MRKKLLAGLLALFVVASGVAPMAAAAGGGLNYDDGKAPGPYYDIDPLTISEYRVSDGGSLMYQADDGDFTSFPGMVNDSEAHDDLGTGHVNEWQFFATDIDAAAFGEFPRNDNEDGDNDASALDASEWSTTGASVSDTNTAQSVGAVEFDASAAGDQMTYNNWSSGGAFVTADAEKRYLQLAYDVESASASTINVTVHDATDGDTVVVDIYDANGDASTDRVGANSTGDGKLYQQQLGGLTASGGDGTLDEIGKIVVAADGAANVDFAAIDAGSTSTWLLGAEYHDDDDDDELESSDITEATGELAIYDPSTMGSAFDDASVRDMDVPVWATASMYADANIDAEFTDADSFPSFDTVLDVTYRLELPDAFDLSYSNVELRQDQKWDETRFATAEYAEATGENTDVEDLEDSDYSSFDSSLGGVDNEATIDGTVSPGDDNVVHLELKLTSGEASAMQATTGGGGAGILGGGSGGGIVDSILSIPGMIVSGLAALLGLRARGS